jgi:hypothetical protein
VHRSDVGTDRAGRLEDGEPVPTGGVHHELALVKSAAVGEHRDDVRKHVVGHGEEQQVAGPGDGGRLAPRYSGEQLGKASTRRVGLTGRGNHFVACGAERGSQDGADAARADNTHPQAGHLNLFRSNPADHSSL